MIRFYSAITVNDVAFNSILFWSEFKIQGQAISILFKGGIYVDQYPLQGGIYVDQYPFKGGIYVDQYPLQGGTKWFFVENNILSKRVSFN
jgi:hypothetical protein